MDEWLDWQARPIPVTHPLSFEGFLRRELFGKLDPALRPPAENLHVPSPFHPDRIGEQLAALGGARACFGGIGYHGHVAFNDPPISRWYKVTVDQLRNSVTRVVVLGDDSIVVQSIGCAGGNPEAIPPMAVTLGMRDILASRRIRLYCAGGERHRAVFRRAVAGEVSVDYPVTLVQGHPGAEVITDLATARPIEIGLR
jgi:glucosamine-6-phosphate deaminase